MKNEDSGERKIVEGDWVRLKSNPEIVVKVRFINPNDTVDFREQRTEDPFWAYISDMEPITNKEQIRELERKLSQQLASRLRQ